MASNPILRSTPLFLFLLVVLITCPSESQRVKQITTMSFYLQELASGRNATVVPVTGISGKSLSFTTFGTIFVMDDPITETPDRNSNQVGRAQGMLVTSALDGSNVHAQLSFVFSNVSYNGSTLELQGAIRQFERYKEISLVSGTGTFRFAKGYATFETIYYDPKVSYSVIRCIVNLLPS